MKEDLLNKIFDRKAVVGVIGLGYVGLPLVLRFWEEGFSVIGFDIDKEKVDKLNRGECYIKHIQEEKIKTVILSGRGSTTSDFSRLKEADCILICVPTPLTLHREPDMSFIIKTAKTMVPYIKEGHLIVLESTTYPGTTEEVVKPILEESGLRCDVDFYLAFSPEREDPNNKDYTTGNIPKVIGGTSIESLEITKALYDLIVTRTVPVSNTKTAEATKLLENIFRSVNIALVNELKIIFTKMGIDIWEVIDAAKTKPFGFMPFYPGPGLGGHCIPIDPFYLTWKAREYEAPTKFIELAGEINTSMPYYVVQRVVEALNERNKSLRSSKILVLGVAYKKDVDDMRESPSIRLIELLQERGAIVDYNDPFIPVFPPLRSHHIALKSIELTSENITSYDLVLIATDHSAYDYEWIVEEAQIVVDTRNATKDLNKFRNKIIKA